LSLKKQNSIMTALTRPIYLDYYSTTPTDKRVAKTVYYYMQKEFGNASSMEHEYGDQSEAIIEKSTQHIADLIGASPREILWTSGATESINLAIQGSLPLDPEKPYRIGLLALEHRAVLDTCHMFADRRWAELIYFRVDSNGRIDLDDVAKICSEGLSLLCVMAANNEIGNIYPLQAIAQIAQKHSIPFLCDASQAVGKIPIQFTEWGITYLAISAHKLYGPKGSGALVIRKGHSLQPMLFGGGQQKGIRPGTLNVPGIAGLGEAARLRSLEMEEDERAIAVKRDRLQQLLIDQIPSLVVNGDLDNRLAGNLHISIPGIPNSAVIARVRHQLAISTGSACSSGVEAPSHVLTAIGLPSELIEGALRIGLGKFTTDQEIEQAAKIMIEAVKQIEKLM
jgi:cysteine desulfurase